MYKSPLEIFMPPVVPFSMEMWSQKSFKQNYSSLNISLLQVLLVKMLLPWRHTMWHFSFSWALCSTHQRCHTLIGCTQRHHSVHKYILEKLSLLCYIKGCRPSSNLVICLIFVSGWEMLANQKNSGCGSVMLSLNGAHPAWTVASLPSLF